ncbi:hypothetical protein AB1N83_005618 [Pleurotus pulmonarius]
MVEPQTPYLPHTLLEASPDPSTSLPNSPFRDNSAPITRIVHITHIANVNITHGGDNFVGTINDGIVGGRSNQNSYSRALTPLLTNTIDHC